MLGEIWEFGHAIRERIDAAILAADSGGPIELELTLTLTADVDAFNAEFTWLERELFG